MASPIKDITWFCTLQLKYEALLRAFKKRSDVCLTVASTRSLKAALKTPSLQSVSFSKNAPASLWPLNGISWRPQNSIVLMIWERRFRFSSTAFCRLRLKHFVHLWICRHLSAQSYRTWLHIIYDSDSFGDYCNVPLPFHNCSVVPKLMSREVLRYDWQSEEQTQRTVCKKLHCKYYCTLTMQFRLTIASGNFDFEHQLLHMETRNLNEGTSN